ncbi:MAG: C4-dicarboxylate ABC transporter substrate-binding protein [Syntrophus sp. (in: bacteria)]|nr:C4-dicarboxylate ABC transporter substrate-binding protein [Syntrophus sp. (in: bacteria)]
MAVRIALVFFAFTICLALAPVASSAEKVISLNYSNFFPALHKNSILIDQWCKEVGKRTNGRVKVAHFPGGTLTPAAQTYDNVVKGIADIGFSVFSYTRGKFPLMEVIDLPLGCKSGATATGMINAFYAKFKPKELDEVKVIYLHAHGPGIVHAKKPVTKLEDMKGLKLRATGLASKIVSALGATPVGTTMPETYDALRTGIVDGSMAPFEALKGFRWGEVINYSTADYGAAYSSGFFVVMNKAKWNSLPPDVQNIFEEVSQEWIVKQANLWDEIDKEGLEFTKKRGNKVIYLSKEEDARWAAAARPLLDSYVKEMKTKGLPGDEALKFCLDYLKKNQK